MPSMDTKAISASQELPGSPVAGEKIIRRTVLEELVKLTKKELETRMFQGPTPEQKLANIIGSR